LACHAAEKLQPVRPCKTAAYVALFGRSSDLSHLSGDDFESGIRNRGSCVRGCGGVLLETRRPICRAALSG
jgi:hypothetical protein